jgi:hypothetical protein
MVSHLLNIDVSKNYGTEVKLLIARVHFMSHWHSSAGRVPSTNYAEDWVDPGAILDVRVNRDSLNAPALLQTLILHYNIYRMGMFLGHMYCFQKQNFLN